MASGPLDYRQRAKPSADEAVFKHQQTKLFHCVSLELAAAALFVCLCEDPFYTGFFSPAIIFLKSALFSPNESRVQSQTDGGHQSNSVTIDDFKGQIEAI